jgi:predicted nucleotidyltransferase
LVSILDILRRLIDHDVEFVLVGGMAAIAFGSSLTTEDLDVAAPLTEQNAARLLAALADIHPRHRMNPMLKALTETPASLAKFENLYLVTDLGQLDVLVRIAGIGAYPDVLRSAVEVDFRGRTIRILNIEALIRSKEALDRPKDRPTIVHLKAILERTRRGKG